MTEKAEKAEKVPTNPSATGKGRPTPKRKEVTVKRGASLAPAKTKEEKKAAKAEARVQRIAQRNAFLRGDESALPSRDRGPVRKYVRNIVDSRINVGEFFLPFIFVVLLVSMTRNQTIAIFSILAMYTIMFVAIIDGWFLGRRIKRRVAEKFPNESTKGLALYGFLRSTQMRRMRAPKPQIKRGEKNF
ncbi:MAG: DUF3043 domain-containing protein [Candidatus Nanopelagicaceae bacterium]|nr:DUF3043 domain-containing protein [Candidatus Nanopelagicaceae bacterium]